MRWITIKEIARKTKTKQFVVQTTEGLHLGYIKFRPQWRKFSFYPDPNTLYEADCLKDIASFCESQTNLWRFDLKRS
jgi:hypothetical protein